MRKPWVIATWPNQYRQTVHLPYTDWTTDSSAVPDRFTPNCTKPWVIPSCTGHCCPWCTGLLPAVHRPTLINPYSLDQSRRKTPIKPHGPVTDRPAGHLLDTVGRRSTMDQSVPNWSIPIALLIDPDRLFTCWTLLDHGQLWSIRTERPRTYCSAH